MDPNYDPAVDSDYHMGSADYHAAHHDMDSPNHHHLSDYHVDPHYYYHYHDVDIFGV